MKIGRILGVFLSILSVAGMINYSIFTDELARSNSFGFADATGVLSDNIVQTGNKVFDMDNTSNVEVLTYKNNFNHEVSITSSNIDIDCKGTGSNALEDAEIVENGFEVNAYFSLNSSGEKYDSMVVPKGKKIYIHVVTEYIGEKYPSNEVKCDYNINLEAA